MLAPGSGVNYNHHLHVTVCMVDSAYQAAKKISNCISIIAKKVTSSTQV